MYPLLSIFSFKATLDSFGPDFQKEVRTSDWAFIEAIFNQHFSFDRFPDVYAINEFVNRGARMGLDKKLYSEIKNKAQTPDYKKFLVLDYNQLRNRERFPRDDQQFHDWHNWFLEEKKKEILKTFNHKNIDGYKDTFNFINICMELELWDFYNVSNAAQILFNSAVEKDINIRELVIYLIQLPKFNQIFSFDRLFNYLRDLAPTSIPELANILSTEIYPNKYHVLLAYYNSLDDRYINKDISQAYLNLLENFEGRFYLYFSNVSNYLKIDRLFLIKVLKVLIANAESGKSDYILNDQFFENHEDDVRDTGLMEKAYLQMLKKENHYDLDGSELMVILKRRPSFYFKVLDQLSDERSIHRSDEKKVAKVWELSDAFKFIEKATNFLASHQRYYYHGEELLAELFENTITVHDYRENRRKFFKDYIIVNAENIKRMKAIFKVIANKVQEDYDELLTVFLQSNKSFTQFETIRWDERTMGLLSGNAIYGEIDERAWQRVKAVLEKMQPSGDYLEHRVFVGRQIAYCQKSAIRERKHNFLRDDY